ncbi:2714_t:CDS:2 [Diversispora eburnea]|uniref:2714_t:CDS:1 n=1 Tax=Diversispora eburnea TaxID=1213867 RepID=A0A9N9FQV1_9GLOM|nr:2714_t:CDS:2 [Diversispora eburnea]
MKEWDEKCLHRLSHFHYLVNTINGNIIGNSNIIGKAARTIDRAENIDDSESNSDHNEDETDSNHDKDESDLDSDEDEYPDKDSPDNIWVLPSRKSIDKIICGPKNLHKSHPSCLEIIRIGSKIKKPELIKQEDWNYLNSSVECPHYNLSTEIEDLFSVLLETNSLNEYKKCLCNATFDYENNTEMIFATDVMLWL